MSGDAKGHEFGATIKALRRAAKLSQEKLAAVVGVSRQTIQHWENKPRVSPRYSHVKRAAKALGTTDAKLLMAIDADNGGEVQALVPSQSWRALVDGYLQSELARGVKPRVIEQLYRIQDRGHLYRAIHATRLDVESRPNEKRR